MKSNTEVQYAISEIEEFAFKAMGNAFPTISFSEIVTIDQDDDGDFSGIVIDADARAYTFVIQEDDPNPLLQRTALNQSSPSAEPVEQSSTKPEA